MLPSSTELNYFIEVSSSLNLSRASERLGISQPSLSLAIKRLEQTIGTALFIRHKNGVTLTQAGKQLSMRARELIQYWEDTRCSALASQQEVQGYFTLGCHSAIAAYTLAGFLPDLMATYPKLEVHFKYDISRKITEQVINLSIDLGIVANPFKHPDLVIRKLGEDEVTFWVGEGDREIQDIHSNHAVIICEPELTQTQNLLKKCKQANIQSERVMTMNSLEMIANLTANGCGIGILPARVAEALYPDKLRRISDAPVYNDEICLVYRNENRQVRAIQEMTEVIKKYFK